MPEADFGHESQREYAALPMGARDCALLLFSCGHGSLIVMVASSMTSLTLLLAIVCRYIHCPLYDDITTSVYDDMTTSPTGSISSYPSHTRYPRIVDIIEIPTIGSTVVLKSHPTTRNSDGVHVSEIISNLPTFGVEYRGHTQVVF